MLKIGVLGVGHLGEIHVKLITQLTQYYKLIGFYDPNDYNAKNIIQKYHIKRFFSLEELIKEVDCLDIVTPTITHFDCASKALKMSKHLFIEKPLTQTIDEAKKLIQLANEAGVKVQVGHVERFNPAFKKAMAYFNNPMFIETHRLANFNPRGTDTPVVLDLMIHDLDIILNVVNSTIKNISASGVPIVSDTPDIANARIEFNNGCVANLTASRISMKNMRKSRFFQKDAYISIDFLKKELEVVRMEDVKTDVEPFDIVFDIGGDKPRKKIIFDKPNIKPINAIEEELIDFHDIVINDLPPIVSIEDAYLALDVAHQILDKLKLSSL